MSTTLRCALLVWVACLALICPVRGQAVPRHQPSTNRTTPGTVKLVPGGGARARPGPVNLVPAKEGVRPGVNPQVQPGANPRTQPGAVPAGTQPRLPGQPAPGHETEQVTIRKALGDLASADPEARLRAVLILGKYRAPNALLGVQKALGDADAKVRRAALVSLAEHPIIQPSAVGEIISMLADPDVHVRRIASSNLPDVLGVRMGVIVGSPVSHRPRRTVYTDEQKEAVQNAFADEDATVRKNMLTYYSLISDAVEPDLLLALFKDPERDNRILALKAAAGAAASNGLPHYVFVQEAKILAEDKDRLIRMTLAEALGRVMSVEANQLLAGLAADTDTQVAAEAFVTLLQRGILTDAAMVDKLLADPALDEAAARSLIMALPMMGSAGGKKLEALFKHERAFYRQYALLAYTQVFSRYSTPELILPLLNDDSLDVRRRARYALQGMTPLPAKAMRSIVSSPHADVRMFGATLAADLPAQDAEETLLDLLLDEDTGVRQSALRQLVTKAVPGWEDIVKQTLEDEDPAMRGAAVDSLSRVQDITWIPTLIELYGDAEDATVRAKLQGQTQRLAQQAFQAGTPAAQRQVVDALSRVQEPTWITVLTQMYRYARDTALRTRVQVQIRRLQNLQRLKQLQERAKAGTTTPGRTVQPRQTTRTIPGKTTIPRTPQNKVNPNVPR